MIFPIPKSKSRLLELIYKQPGINISDLFRKAKLSPKSGYRYVGEFSKSNIILQETTGKKPLLRRLFPNLKSGEGRLIFALLEEDGKLDFLNRHKEFIGPFDQLIKNLGKREKIHSVLVFGSYSRGSETNESDLDLVFIAERSEKNQVRDITEKCFVTLKTRVSIRMITKKEFLDLKGSDELIKSIIRDHVCLLNPIKFIDLIS